MSKPTKVTRKDGMYESEWWDFDRETAQTPAFGEFLAEDRKHGSADGYIESVYQEAEALRVEVSSSLAELIAKQPKQTRSVEELKETLISGRGVVLTLPKNRPKGFTEKEWVPVLHLYRRWKDLDHLQHLCWVATQVLADKSSEASWALRTGAELGMQVHKALRARAFELDVLREQKAQKAGRPKAGRASGEERAKVKPIYMHYWSDAQKPGKGVCETAQHARNRLIHDYNAIKRGAVPDRAPEELHALIAERPTWSPPTTWQAIHKSIKKR